MILNGAIEGKIGGADGGWLAFTPKLIRILCNFFLRPIMGSGDKKRTGVLFELFFFYLMDSTISFLSITSGTYCATI